MGTSSWITEHWFELLQSVGIIAGLLFTTYSLRKDDKARRIANLLAIAQQHRDIWQELFKRPELARVLESDVDLESSPVSEQEGLFVNLLILHLSNVHRARKEELFVNLEGFQMDIEDFFALPIPKTIWEEKRAFQNEDFVRFVEAEWRRR